MEFKNIFNVTLAAIASHTAYSNFVQNRKTGNSVYLFIQKSAHKLKMYSTHQLTGNCIKTDEH